MSTPSYRCWAEIDLGALRENLLWLRHRVGPDVKIMTVVKADAYGHGLRPIAALLMQSGTDIFGVANLTEAQTIRAVGRGWPILMLGASLPDEIPAAVRDGVMPTISRLEEAKRFSREAVRQGRVVEAHLKVDTGMGRLGTPPDEAVQLALALSRLPGLRLGGVFTHFSSAEDDAPFTRRQEKVFGRVLAALQSAGVRPPLIHASNSAGLLHSRRSRHSLVRPGLLVYGIVPAGKRRAPLAWRRQLRPALAWKARVSFVKLVPAGTPLSYGHTFITPQPMRVATVTAGYGDGFSRAGSQRAQVLIGGRRCPVVGRVTMDQMLVDVSRVRRVRDGDEVVLIGRQGRARITAQEVADWLGTIPWEVLTGITHRVPRVYRGGAAS